MSIHCPHFALCSGCSLDTDVARNQTYEEAKKFFLEKQIYGFHLHAGAICEWRYRAKLSVRGTKEKPLIGLFQEGTHTAIDIPLCKVHHPLINEAVNIVRGWIEMKAIVPYNETTGQGFLRYIELILDRKKQRVQLVLVVNQGQAKMTVEQKEAIKSLWKSHFEKWHSVWLNFNERRDNVIFGGVWEKMYGEEWLWDCFCGRQICFHPASFSQANPEMFEKLLEELKKNVPQGAKIVEFYAGGGTIGLTMAEQAKTIVFNEITPVAKECFEETKKRLPKEIKEKIQFVSGPVEQHLSLINQGIDLVIVDPPRKGLDEKLLERLCGGSSVNRLIYVSCGWKSFKRDCQRLIKADWRLTKATSFLFFPGTDHIEILAIFER